MSIHYYKCLLVKHKYGAIIFYSFITALSQHCWTVKGVLFLLNHLGPYSSESSDRSLRAVLPSVETQFVSLPGQCSSDWHMSEWSICQSVGHSGAAELGQRASQDRLDTLFLYLLAKDIACHLHLSAGRRVQEDCYLAQWQRFFCTVCRMYIVDLMMEA